MRPPRSALQLTLNRLLCCGPWVGRTDVAHHKYRETLTQQLTCLPWIESYSAVVPTSHSTSYPDAANGRC
jgi:hypothetical protein